jgi:hypothetical protein
MARNSFTVLLFLAFLAVVNAQFGNIFEQFMGQQQGHQQQGQRQQGNVASDSSWYQKTYNNGKFDTSRSWGSSADSNLAQCSDYLCPGTLACVSVPHHCPCQFPAVEDKVELGDGSAICISKGGFKAGEAARKIELARKGRL